MPDFKISIVVKDVTKGDVKDLITLIEDEHGDDFDIRRGDFAVTASEADKIGGWFRVELDDES